MIMVLEKENQTKLVDNQNNYIFEVSSFKKIFQGVGTLTQLSLERLKPLKFLFLKKWIIYIFIMSYFSRVNVKPE